MVARSFWSPKWQITQRVEVFPNGRSRLVNTDGTLHWLPAGGGYTLGDCLRYCELHGWVEIAPVCIKWDGEQVFDETLGVVGDHDK